MKAVTLTYVGTAANDTDPYDIGGGEVHAVVDEATHAALLELIEPWVDADA